VHSDIGGGLSAGTGFRTSRSRMMQRAEFTATFLYPAGDWLKSRSVLRTSQRLAPVRRLVPLTAAAISEVSVPLPPYRLSIKQDVRRVRACGEQGRSRTGGEEELRRSTPSRVRTRKSTRRARSHRKGQWTAYRPIVLRRLTRRDACRRILVANTSNFNRYHAATRAVAREGVGLGVGRRTSTSWTVFAALYLAACL